MNITSCWWPHTNLKSNVSSQTGMAIFLLCTCWQSIKMDYCPIFDIYFIKIHSVVLINCLPFNN